MFNKKEIKINTSFNHEGKCLVEVIKSKNQQKFIKQYYLNSIQLSILQYYINKKNISHNIVNQDGIINQDDIVNNKNLEVCQNEYFFNHPEFKNNYLNNLEAYKQTLRAKYTQ